MTLGPVRVMGAGVVPMMSVEEVNLLTANCLGLFLHIPLRSSYTYVV